MTRVVLSIGSNLGDRLARLQSVVDGLGDAVRAMSPVYETDAWGGVEQGPFLNAVVIADDPELDAHGWLRRAHELERAAERVRDQRWGPRTLDVDLVTCHDAPGSEVISRDDVLTLPHPFAHQRAFVLVPWLAVDPDADADRRRRAAARRAAARRPRPGRAGGCAADRPGRWADGPTRKRDLAAATSSPRSSATCWCVSLYRWFPPITVWTGLSLLAVAVAEAGWAFYVRAKINDGEIGDGAGPAASARGGAQSVVIAQGVGVGGRAGARLVGRRARLSVAPPRLGCGSPPRTPRARWWRR